MMRLMRVLFLLGLGVSIAFPALAQSNRVAFWASSSTPRAAHTFTPSQKSNTAFNYGGSATCVKSGLTAFSSGQPVLVGITYSGNATLTISSIRDCTGTSACASSTSTWNTAPGTTSCSQTGNQVGVLFAWAIAAGASTNVSLVVSGTPSGGVLVMDVRTYSASPNDSLETVDSATSTSNTAGTSGSVPGAGARPGGTGTPGIIMQIVNTNSTAPSAIDSSYGNTEFVGHAGFADLVNVSFLAAPSWTASGTNTSCAAQLSIK